MQTSAGPREISIGIVGSGGDGVVLLGELLARSSSAAGLYCHMDKVFGPQIRGGESSVSLRVATQPVLRSADELDVLLVFQWADLARFPEVLIPSAGCLVLCPLEDAADPLLHGLPADFHGPLLRLPLKELALEAGRSKQARNMVLLGAFAELAGWYPQELAELLARRMQLLDERSRDNNLAALEAGREFARGWEQGSLAGLPQPAGPGALELATGNELLCRAALAAGCRFMAGYPITPASEILEYMSRRLPALGGNCIQAEDEMAAACLTLGSALGGVRSMSATSGPGMTLKSESIALAGMAGLPMLVVDVQRCGPSTGIPTRTEQADLNLALYGAHGDSPRIVLAAAHAADCAELAGAAFELAGDCRVPVVLLSEQQIAQGLGSVPPELAIRTLDGNDNWKAAALGSAVQVQLTGLEHDAAGKPLSDARSHAENAALRQARVDRARGKLPPLLYGRAAADSGLLCFGGSYSACREAVDSVSAAGGSIGLCCLRMLAPLDTDSLADWIAAQGRVVVVEMNHSGQLLGHLRSQGLELGNALSLRRAGGRPWRLAEILGFLAEHALIPEQSQ